jgi:hypothetical protein
MVIEPMRVEGEPGPAGARALGDPARLAVVDALTVRDAAPSELGASLEMPPNLVPVTRLVVRAGSEGDHPCR